MKRKLCLVLSKESEYSSFRKGVCVEHQPGSLGLMDVVFAFQDRYS